MRQQQQLLLAIGAGFLIGLGVCYVLFGMLNPPGRPGPAAPAAAARPATPQTAQASEVKSREQTRTVKRVVDGVTLEVEGEGTIKLAAVELPPYTPADNSDPGRKDAPTYLRTEVLDKPVRLERVSSPGGDLSLNQCGYGAARAGLRQ
jgi:endonuclease YncB( thermonuclease family)